MFGIGELNEAGQKLMQLANANKLVAANTCLKQLKAYKQIMLEFCFDVTVRVRMFLYRAAGFCYVFADTFGFPIFP